MDWILVSPSPKIHTLSLTVRVTEGRDLLEVIRIRWGNEGGAYMNRIGALLRVFRDLLPLFALCHVRIQQEVSSLKTQNKALIRTCWNSDLRFLSYRTVRNKSVFYKPPSLWYFVTAVWAKTKTLQTTTNQESTTHTQEIDRNYPEEAHLTSQTKL